MLDLMQVAAYASICMQVVCRTHAYGGRALERTSVPTPFRIVHLQHHTPPHPTPHHTPHPTPQTANAKILKILNYLAKIMNTRKFGVDHRFAVLLCRVKHRIVDVVVEATSQDQL